jgi:hypothetical protein
MGKVGGQAGACRTKSVQQLKRVALKISQPVGCTPRGRGRESQTPSCPLRAHTIGNQCRTTAANPLYAPNDTVEIGPEATATGVAKGGINETLHLLITDRTPT